MKKIAPNGFGAFFIHSCMALAGIDYSLCGPCICIYDGKLRDRFDVDKCAFYYLTSVRKNAEVFGNIFFGEMFEDYNHECERYESIADWAVDKVLGCDQIALEGYAYSATGRAVFQIAENCGVLKYKLHQYGKPVEIIPPTAVKKFATTKGNANKERMVNQFKEDTGIDLMRLITPDRKEIGNPVSDIADSYYICWKLHSDLNARGV